VRTGAAEYESDRNRLAVKIIAASNGRVTRFNARQPIDCTASPASNDAHACEPNTVKSFSAWAR
jgi:hypothetical protein